MVVPPRIEKSRNPDGLELQCAVTPTPPSNLHSICLVRLSALGDVCLLVPTVQALRTGLPGAGLTWVIDQSAYSLVEGLPGIDFLVMDKRRGWRELLRVRRELRARSFDVLLAAQSSFRAHLLYQAVTAPVKLGFDRERATDLHSFFINRRIPFRREHFLDSFRSFAMELGLPKPELRWELPVNPEDHAWAQARLPGGPHRWLAVCLAASKAERNWPPDRYATVLDYAVERQGCRVVLIGVERDRAAAKAVLSQMRHRAAVLDLLGQSTPKRALALLALVDALLAPDSGPVHLATAVGTPVVGLYAVAPPELSGPYLSPQLVANRFPDAVRQFLGKDPAQVPWRTRVHHEGAMRLITVDEVIARLDLALAAAPRRC